MALNSYYCFTGQNLHLLERVQQKSLNKDRPILSVSQM